jgi:hypothetical protein
MRALCVCLVRQAALAPPALGPHRLRAAALCAHAKSLAVSVGEGRAIAELGPRPDLTRHSTTGSHRKRIFPSWQSRHSLNPSGPIVLSAHPQRTDGESLSPCDPPTTLDGCGPAYLQRVHLAAVPPTASEVKILARNDSVSVACMDLAERILVGTKCTPSTSTTSRRSAGLRDLGPTAW